jgi:pyruvate/2-oxoglutarate/acetoin dehydrogenase E1 component
MLKNPHFQNYTILTYMYLKNKMVRKIKFNKAINEAIYQTMSVDKKVLCYGLGATDPRRVFYTTTDLLEKFGNERVFDIPTSENAMTGVAIGLANMGSKVVLSHQRVDFSFLSMDQIINNLSKWHYMFGGIRNLAITIRLIIGRGWGQGPTHSQSYQSFFAKIPGLKVVMPSSPKNAKGLLISSILDPNPVIFFEHRWLYDLSGHVPKKFYKYKINKSEIKLTGNDITIIGMSNSTHEILSMKKFFKENKISAEIIDLISISPLDMNTIIKSVKKTGKLVIFDTCHKSFSTGREIISNLIEFKKNIFKKEPILLGMPNTPTPTGFSLTKKYYPTKEDLAKSVAKILDIKKLNTNSIPKILEHDKPKEFVGPF